MGKQHDEVGNQGRRDRLLPIGAPMVRLFEDLLDDAKELTPSDRFRQHRVGVGLVGLTDNRLVEPSRHQDARERPLRLADPTERFQAGQPGHVHIKQNEVDFSFLDNFQRFSPILRQEGLDPQRFKDDLERFAERLIVVGNE